MKDIKWGCMDDDPLLENLFTQYLIAGKSFVKPSAGKSGSGGERSTRPPSCRSLTPLRGFPSRCAKSYSTVTSITTVPLRLPWNMQSGAVQDPILSVLSLEEMKQEATRHIELLKLGTQAIWDFE